MFCTGHLKLSDTHKASVMVCLPELSLDCRFVLQKIWEEMLKKTLAIRLLMNSFNAHIIIDHRGILENAEGPLNAK